MSKFFWQVAKTAPAVLGVSLLFASGALAQEAPQAENEATDGGQVLEQINQDNDGQTDAMDQVTSVSQLRDVSPGDWAFEALRNLVERYGCIAGYPDGTFRGSKPLTRYEFAAGLNACLQQIERLIAGGRGAGVSDADLEQIRKLSQEFQSELATLGARVDNLEGKVAVLEENQFSTTTKLNGEAIFTAAGVFGDEKVGGGDLDDNITLSDRVRLNFDTSFTGKDRLRTRLQAGNFVSLANATGTDMARLGHDAGGNNNVTIDEVYYRFPVGDQLRVYLGAFGMDVDDVFNVHNPYFESSGTGALSRFNRYDPLVYRAPQGAGLGVNFKFNDSIGLTGLYLVPDSQASDPANGSGLFNGSYSAGAQLDVALGKAFDFGVTYLHTYEPAGSVNLSSSTGSTLAKDPFGLGLGDVGTSANRVGIAANWRPTSKINIGGWGGYINAQAEQSGAFASKGDNADVITWAAHLALLDFGGEGNVLGLIGGQPPKLTSSDTGVENSGNSYLIEAQYRLQVNDNITITPGAYVILEPDHVDGAKDIWVATIRTTFKF